MCMWPSHMLCKARSRQGHTRDHRASLGMGPALSPRCTPSCVPPGLVSLSVLHRCVWGYGTSRGGVCVVVESGQNDPRSQESNLDEETRSRLSQIARTLPGSICGPLAHALFASKKAVAAQRVSFGGTHNVKGVHIFCVLTAAASAGAGVTRL